MSGAEHDKETKMTEERVFLARIADYNEAIIYDRLGRFLDQPRFQHLLQPGKRILLKPNLLIGKPADTCITTHPLFVRAIARLFVDHGVTLLLGDSPAIGSANYVARKTGLKAALEGLPVEIVDFSDTRLYPIPHAHHFREIELTGILSEVDAVVNLPKIKTHGQMIMTMAVKNLFGCVVGLRKTQWHLQAGRSHEFFAEMLVHIADIVRPALTIVDGIMGMEGNGPSAGRPRALGFVVAGTDPIAVDRVILECLGIKPHSVMTMIAAERLGVGQPDLAQIQIEGDCIDDCRINDFVLPSLKSAMGNRLPYFIVKRLKRWWTDLPSIDMERCNLCETCVRQCPAEALSLNGRTDARQFISLDTERCISCFCCQEVCPEGAMQVHTAVLGRFSAVFRKR